MLTIDELAKRIRRIRGIGIKTLNDREELLLSLYKMLLKLSKKGFNSSEAYEVSNSIKGLLPGPLAEEVAKEFSPLLEGSEKLEVPNLYDFLVELEKRKIRLLHPCYPYEVLKLGVSALNPEEDATVYNPYPDAYGFAYWLSKHRKVSVFTEDPYKTEIPRILNENSNLSIKYSFGEPICSRDRKFDYSISLVWQSKQVSKKCKEEEVKGWSEILTLNHLLKVSRKRIVAFFPSSFLTRIRGNFSSMRSEILQYLDAVVLLPGNIFYSTVSSYCMLVLDMQKTCRNKDSEILFVDASSFFEIGDFGRKNVLQYERVLEVLKDKRETRHSVKLPAYQVKKLDKYCRLHPRFYLKENLDSIRLVSEARKVNLGSLVKVIASPFIRNTLKQSKGRELLISELQIMDIPEDGVIKEASVRRRRVFNEEEYKDSIIQPKDILLSVRGVVGKVGIVLDVPEDEIWVPSQTLVILRAEPGKVDPLALFVFLRSEVGQFLLQSAKSGEVLDYIPLRTLSSIEIPLLNEEQQKTLREFFKGERKRYSSIEEIKGKISRDRKTLIEKLFKKPL